MTPDGYFDCKKCGTSWSSTTLCHCAACCRSFTGLEGFDRHQVITCDKKTCTPADPCDGITRRHYPTGRRSVHCVPDAVEGEALPGEDGRVRSARPGGFTGRQSAPNGP